MGSLPFFTYFSTLIFSSSMILSSAADTISPAQSIRDGETLVSASQRFELGFFTPGKSNNRYLGIWFKFSPGTVVWVANRRNPITDTQGVLVMSDDGNLALLSNNKSIIWSTNSSKVPENPVALLLDSGNLVLRDKSSGSYVTWQSFDYPSDTLLAGMKVGWNLKTGFERYLTSWVSDDDPSPGEFTYRLEIMNGPPQVYIAEGTNIKHRSGPWNGRRCVGIPILNELVFKPIMMQKKDEVYYMYEPANNTVITRLLLHHSGVVHRFVWNWNTNEWTRLYHWPIDECDSYAKCGPNGICRISKTPNCECLKGFVPKEKDVWNTWSGKCIEKLPAECPSGERFLRLSRTKVPDGYWSNTSMNLKECEAECYKNCSCKAYANADVRGGGSGCLMWFGELIDIRECPAGFDWGQDFYLRVPASELDSNPSEGTSTDPAHKKNRGGKKQLWIIVVSIVTLTVVILGLVMLWVRGKLRRKGGKIYISYSTISAVNNNVLALINIIFLHHTGEDLLLFDLARSPTPDSLELTEDDKLGKRRINEVKLPLFSFASVCAATDNFSTANKLGEGGFGPVYKGTLLKGDEIAVKRLSKKSRQGWEEFKNEAQLIVNLQHKNLVRIFGYCIEKEEKILIYEYLSNKSLDFFLFDATNHMLLDWGTRVRIIEGIAQGLLYLHEYSRLRIIHRDLKTSNILLDSDMNPKISDFGMARIFYGNELQANTRHIVGTYGYMSPEYALEGLFSIKSDVFSFGVLLLEIVSGKKNTGFSQTTSLNLLGYAWDMWTSEKVLDLKDPVLEVPSSKHTLLRYVNIGLLCVQERAEDRPTMSDVVSMLFSEIATLPSPKQPAFSHLRSTANSIPSINSSTSDHCSVNNVTISLLQAR